MRNVSPRRVVAIRRRAAFGGTAPITPLSFSGNSGHAPRPLPWAVEIRLLFKQKKPLPPVFPDASGFFFLAAKKSGLV